MGLRYFLLKKVLTYSWASFNIEIQLMKPLAINPQSVKSHGIQNSTKFGIKSTGLHHILGILRNQLYSDKVLAVIREYTCNAVDAHTEALCGERPIEVTFPTRMNPNFSVRDFGHALSDDEIQNVYAFYGESTKRNSNDQIGMLGIGSKSAFAYGDNFVINSFIDGKKNTYNAFIDPSQVGQISKLSVEDTDEENGIEIVVPIKDDDAEEFRKKGEALFKWYKVRPIVKGVAQFVYDDDEVLFSGDGWEWRNTSNDRYNRGEAMAVMGNIGYPIDDYALNLGYDDDYKNLLTDSLVLKIDIGDLEISASREKLQYTDYSKKNLKKMLMRVQKEIADQIGKQFGECKTLFDAKCLYGAVFQTTSALYSLKDSIKKHLTWKGKVIDGSSFSTYTVTGVDLINYKKAYRSGRYTAQEQNTIHCDKDVVIVLNDVGHRRGSMGKILPLIHHKNKNPYILEFKTYQAHDTGKTITAKSVEKKWRKESQFDGKMLLLSELPQHKLSEFDGYQKQSGGSSYTPNVKHSAKCFEFDMSNDLRAYHTKKSDYWKVADLDVENDSGVYVIIDKFHVENPKVDGYVTTSDPKEIKNLKDIAEQCDIKFPKHIYAFKAGQRDKIEGKDGWTELHTWAREQIEKVINDNNLHQAWIDIQKVDELNQYTEGSNYYGSKVKEQITNLKKLQLADVIGTMGDFLAKHTLMCHGEKTHKQIKAIQTVAKEYQVDFNCPKGVKPTFDIKGLYKSMLEKYDMLPLLKRDIWTYEFDKDAEKKLENYVNVIDLCN
jgi:hypothetical protein